MFLAALACLAVAPASLPKLTPRGTDLVDPKGKAVVLKGCNLGNWLILEGWMLNMDFPDGYTFMKTLSDRFGEAEKDRLMDVYRSSWITERDWKIIQSYGFNLVRLPMDYRLFEDDAKPFKLKPNAWKWIDKAVNEAEKHGLYTILDMHGAQGGQSVYDHTGRSGQNKLWSVPENQDRLAWLWGQIAKRYKKRSAVLAYDVFNEPYGAPREQLKPVFQKALTQIRKNDPDKLVLAHGHTDGYHYYGDPKANGWKNVGFQMHYYPGLFGNGDPTLLTHARHLASIEEVAKGTKAVAVPFLVGEMNVVFKDAGGAMMMRRTFDAHAKHGWMTTMWSYKVSSEEGSIGNATWGMATNRKPVRKIDVKTASRAEIEAWMRGFASDDLVVYEELRDALTAKNPVLPPLPALPPKIREVPYQDSLPGWTILDMAGARKGGLRLESGGKFTLYGAGHDVWNRSDQVRFLYRELTGDFDLSVMVESLPEVDRYSKAGILARASLSPDSPAVTLSVFANGEAQHAERPAVGDETTGKALVKSALPMRVRMVRRGDDLDLFIATGPQEWQKLGTSRAPAKTLFVGLIALSHDDSQLVPVGYSGLTLK